MIKVNRMFLTALVCSSFATMATAVKLEVMPTVAKAFKTSDDSLKDDEILYGVRGTVFLNDEVGVQAAFEASTGNSVGANGAETDIERVSANIVYERNNGKRIRPYFMVGVGNESTHGLVAPSQNDGSQGFIQAGAGLKFGINKNIDVVTEAKWLRKLSNDDDDIVATVGLGVNTGSSTPKAAPIPSVTETSEVQNAINLAEFRKKYAKPKANIATATVAAATTVATTIPVVETISTVDAVSTITQDIPADAIVLDEDATLPEAEVVTQEAEFVEDAPVVSEVSNDAQDGYYVQMAALFTGTGAALTNRLEQKDYPYVLHNVEKSGREATLVLVGPYESRLEASVAMKYLKTLKSDAFIYHTN